MPDLDRERALGVRLAVASGLGFALLVPFALIAVWVAGDWAPLHTLDLSVAGTLHGFAVGHPGWVRVMAVWSVVFDPNGWRLAALIVVIWLFRRGARRLGWWVLITMAAGGLLAALLKLLVGRHRPDFLDPVARAAGYSFPSGHAMNAALGAGVLLLVLLPLVPRWRVAVRVAAVVLPVVTGVFRIGLGVHYVSDVVGGWLLGVAMVTITAAVFDHWPTPRDTRRGVTPDAEG